MALIAEIGVDMSVFHLRAVPVGDAISAAKTEGSNLKDKFHRLKPRRRVMLGLASP